jgi:hypothetical protein
MVVKADDNVTSVTLLNAENSADVNTKNENAENLPFSNLVQWISNHSQK